MASTKRDGLYKRKGSRFWWVRTDPLDGVPRSTGCTDIEAARLWRAARERLAADPAAAAAKEAKLGEWIGRTIAMIARQRSAATVSVYENKLGHFRRLWGDDCALSTIGPEKVDAYVKERRGEASDETISREVRHLTYVLRLAKRSHCYAGDLSTLRPLDLHGHYEPRTRWLTPVELAALLDECGPELGALVRVCVALGCRRSEALKLGPGDVYEGLARIHGTKTASSAREVPVLSVFRSLLEAARALLPIKATSTNVNRELYWACRRARIDHCSFNDFRRTHASWLLAREVDRDHVRRLLGHTTTKLVDTVYGQLGPTELAALIEPKLLSAGTLQSEQQIQRPQRESNPRYRRERPPTRFSGPLRNRLIAICSEETTFTRDDGLWPMAARLGKYATAFGRYPDRLWAGRKGQAA